MSAGCSVIVYEDEQICQKLRQGVHGFLKVRNFGGEFGEAISFCRFSAKIALSRHKSPDLSSDFEKTIRKPYNAGLSPEEMAIMSFVQKIVIQAHQVNEDDIEELRKHGLSDEEILDIVAAARLAVSLAKHSMRSAQNLMTHIWNSNLN